MKEDPLTALQRHFEEQYGKLDIPGVKSKKRKRRQVEETQKDDSWVSSDEEWNGIESTVNVQPEPSPRVISFTDSVQVVSFTDSVQAAEEDDPKSYKSFMVCDLYSTNDSHQNPLNQRLSRRRYKLHLPPHRTTKH
jgi:hypothetical protein